MLGIQFEKISHMMKYFVSYILIVLEICLLANRIVQSRSLESIVGAPVANLHQFRYQLSVQNEFHFHLCGAGLIQRRYAVSVARCFIDDLNNTFKSGYISIAAGSVRLDGRASRVQVMFIYVPRHYRRTNPHTGRPIRTAADISVLELAYDLNIITDPRVRALSLPIEPYIPDELDILEIAGFGGNNVLNLRHGVTRELERRITSDNTLRYADVDLVDNEVCQSMYLMPILGSNICGKLRQAPIDEPRGTCRGDEGSPLVADGFLLVGILSKKTRGCDERIKPAVYINAFSFRNFILDVMHGVVGDDMRIATWTRENEDAAYQFIEI